MKIGRSAYAQGYGATGEWPAFANSLRLGKRVTRLRQGYGLARE